MVFEKIDKNSWNRKEYFDHYFAVEKFTKMWYNIFVH